MIGQNADETAVFLDSFKEVAGINSLTAEKQEEFDELISSAFSTKFPGALLSYPRAHEATIYYAIATTSAEWRRLRPLLIAFAGPTLTSFRGEAESLQPSLSVEAFLLSKEWHVVVRLVPGRDIRVVQTARRSLVRMIKTIDCAPTTTHEVPQSTNRLIAKFVDFLNGNNRTEAERILEICRAELRVDALNLSFMRIQLLAHFNDWRSVCEMPEFSSLCYTRKPPAIAVALLEALYQTHLSLIDGEDWVNKQRICWRNEVHQFALPLLRLPIPHMCKPGALRIYAWDALDAEPRRPDLEEAVLMYRDSIGELASVLELSGRIGFSLDLKKTVPSSTSFENPVASAQRALVMADGADTLATIRDALAQLEGLEEECRRELLCSEPFRSLWQNLHVETGGAQPPTDWIGWLRCLPDPEFTSAFSILRRAVSEWPASELVDPVEIAEFAAALGSIQDAPPASERIADAIPFLTAWAVEDLQFPRANMLSVYETLLFHLVVGTRRASTVYESATLLIRALLTIGLPSAQYGALLDDCLELIGSGIGTRNVYWLLDILEETVLNPTPSPERRHSFWCAAYARLVPLRPHLSPGQYLTLNKLAASLGWDTAETEAFTSLPSATEMDNLRTALSGTSVAIYSLTESAARQAGQALTVIAPSVKISISNDTCGTAALKSMAQNADIFVIATASAKHAATGFIQQMRPRNKPVLFAAGRGVSSIIRAIEDYLLGLM